MDRKVVAEDYCYDRMCLCFIGHVGGKAFILSQAWIHFVLSWMNWFTFVIRVELQKLHGPKKMNEFSQKIIKWPFYNTVLFGLLPGYGSILTWNQGKRQFSCLMYLEHLGFHTFLIEEQKIKTWSNFLVNLWYHDHMNMLLQIHVKIK